MTALFGSPKSPTMYQSPTPASYSAVTNAAVNQMANAASAAGPSSTIKTTPQGANSLATIRTNPIAGT